MKTFLTILIVLAVAGYNIWVFFENKDIDEYNDALDNYNKALYEKSLPVAQRLCEEKDYASACNLLAIHYENGHAVAKNETKAFELYKKGCEGGDKESACYNLALNYLDGIGVEQNINKAKEMLDELCSGILDKNKDACDMLAKLENKPQESKKQNAGATQNYNTSQNLNTQTQKEQIIKDLYAKYMINQEPNQSLLALLSKDTKMLWNKAENTDDGMICLEFDPVIDGQDWDAKELKKSLKIGSGTSYGTLLDDPTIINTAKELLDLTGATSQTLTVATAVSAKLDTIYVKLIDATEEMIANDPNITSKKPCEVCSETDEGAMTLREYIVSKNWIISG